MVITFLALLFFGGLSLLKFFTKKGFYIAQLLAAIVWGEFFTNTSYTFLILWILASVAALVIPSRSELE